MDELMQLLFELLQKRDALEIRVKLISTMLAQDKTPEEILAVLEAIDASL